MQLKDKPHPRIPGPLRRPTLLYRFSLAKVGLVLTNGRRDLLRLAGRSFMKEVSMMFWLFTTSYSARRADGVP